MPPQMEDSPGQMRYRKMTFQRQWMGTPHVSQVCGKRQAADGSAQVEGCRRQPYIRITVCGGRSSTLCRQLLCGPPIGCVEDPVLIRYMLALAYSYVAWCIHQTWKTHCSVVNEHSSTAAPAASCRGRRHPASYRHPGQTIPMNSMTKLAARA